MKMIIWKLRNEYFCEVDACEAMFIVILTL
jgi:hypothetical protein